MFDSIIEKLRGLIEDIAPSPATLAGRSVLALQTACCGLLMEVARLDSSGAEPKRKAVAQAMQKQFGTSSEELGLMIANLGLPQNRLISYYRPVALINTAWAPEQKVQLVEHLWRVAMADGKIDMYEEQLVRKLADLLYVPHSDFILAKHRVQSAGER